MRFNCTGKHRIQAIDKEGKEQIVTIEAQSSQDAFKKAREQGLFPTKIVETVDEAGIVTKGLPPTEPGKRITVSPLRQVLAVAAAAGAWGISSLVCSALTGGPTGFSETTAKFLPFVFAFFAYGAVAMAGRKDV